MIDISFETHPELYIDYVKALEFLKNIKGDDYDPVRGIFHLYTEVKNEKELLSVKSFFATQNLDHAKLILWSDWDIRGNKLLEPFKNYIDFRVYDPVELAKGTLLEGNERLQATDNLHYLKSGMLRFLAPYKMGGLWYDMDMVLLRDLVPVLDQEFAYMWGSETDFAGFGPCAAFMNIHEKSEHALTCLEEIAKAPIVPNTVCWDHQLLAKVYRRRPFTVFPSAFFNTEWQINKKYPGRGTKIEESWFKKNNIDEALFVEWEYSDTLFLEAFSWHWHNSSHKDDTIEPGSKFHTLNLYIDKLLSHRGII